MKIRLTMRELRNRMNCWRVVHSLGRIGLKPVDMTAVMTAKRLSIKLMPLLGLDEPQKIKFDTRHRLMMYV